MKSVWLVSLSSLFAVFGLSGLGAFTASCWGWKGDSAAWFSAFATSLAIVAAILAVRLQLLAQAQTEQVRRVELAQVAYDLAGEALELVTDRLDVALAPNQPGATLALREHRTTETVLAMREIEPYHVPPTILGAFVQLRSGVYAINQRISEVYAKSEADPSYDIHKQLSGAVAVHRMAISAFARLGNDVEAELKGDLLTRRLIATPVSISAFPAKSARRQAARP